MPVPGVRAERYGGWWIDGWIGKAGEYPDWSDGENEVDLAAGGGNDGTSFLGYRVGLNIYSNEIKGYLDPPI